MIRITQYREKCIGCYTCAELAPFRWRMSKKDGKSTLLGAENKKGFFHFIAGRDELDINRKAAEACPSRVIQVTELR